MYLNKKLDTKTLSKLFRVYFEPHFPTILMVLTNGIDGEELEFNHLENYTMSFVTENYTL